MPQLVKGGKYIFGWSRVGEIGKIIIPPDAFIEYQFTMAPNAYLLSGSKKSGGFGITTLDLLKSSQFSDILNDHPELENPEYIFGNSIKYDQRIFCVVPFKDRSINVPFDVLELYGVKKGRMLLTVRGSYVALGFIVKGPIVEEAKRHPKLKIYE